MLENILLSAIVLASFVPGAAFLLRALGALLRDPVSLHRKLQRELNRSQLPWIARPRLDMDQNPIEKVDYAVRARDGILFLGVERKLFGDIESFKPHDGQIMLNHPEHGRCWVSDPVIARRAGVQRLVARFRRPFQADTAVVVPGRGLIPGDPHVHGLIAGPQGLRAYLKALPAPSQAQPGPDHAWRLMVSSGNPRDDDPVAAKTRLLAFAGNLAAAVALVAGAGAVWTWNAF
jgi:hypothetical protein